MHQKFYGTIQGKDFTLDKPDQFKTNLSKLAYKTTNARIELTIKRVRKTRSVRQNNLYWFYLTFIANEIGEDDINGLHDYFKSLFLADNSKKIPVIKSTAELSTIDFMEYIAKIGRKVGEFGITLPDPDQYYLSEPL